jgi:hypothetical protein
MLDQCYIPVTMYNKTVVYSTELQKLFCGYGLYLIRVKYL